jgi:hypothetical protein
LAISGGKKNMAHDIEVSATVTDNKAAQSNNFCLHISEKRLIDLIRSIKNGEINSIKIQNGLPVFYVINLKDRRFM